MSTECAYIVGLPGELRAQPPNALSRFRSRRQGKLAYKHHLHPEAGGWFTYTKSLLEIGHLAESKVYDAMRSLLDPIERDVLRLSVAVVRNRAENASLITRTDQERVAATCEPSASLASTRRLRAASAFSSRAEEVSEQIDAAMQFLAEAVQARLSVYESGRAFMSGYAARFNTLAACHRAGFDDALGKASPSSAPLTGLIPGPPGYVPAAEWVSCTPQLEGIDVSQAVGDVISEALQMLAARVSS